MHEIHVCITPPVSPVVRPQARPAGYCRGAAINRKEATRNNGKSPQSSNRQDQRGDQRRQRRGHIYLSRVRQDLHPHCFLGSTSQPRPRSGRCLNSRSAHSRTPRPPQRRLDDSSRSGHPDDAAAEHSCTRPGQVLGRLAQWHKPRRTSAVHLPERSSGPGRGDPAGKCLAGRSRAAGPLQVEPYAPAAELHSPLVRTANPGTIISQLNSQRARQARNGCGFLKRRNIWRRRPFGVAGTSV
jgi:hypothetical protein